MKYLWLIFAAFCGWFPAVGGEMPATVSFRQQVEPILANYCSDCHADGAKKGGIAFDELKTDSAILDHEVWLKVLKNTRAGLMPPVKKPRPVAEEQKKLEEWIKFQAFGIDPKDPDPGRVTVRRLNRVEYRNTIRDLLGVEFDTNIEFPPDDTGYGFDTIADVLTVSPLLMEKYVSAAKQIVGRSVPTKGKTMSEKVIPGAHFRSGNKSAGREDSGPRGDRVSLSYYEPAAISNVFQAEHAGRYKLVLDLTANEKFVDNVFDYNKCLLVFKADGKELLRQEFAREDGRALHYEYDQDWQVGAHTFEFELQPLTLDAEQVRSLTMRVDTVTVRGPQEERYWLRPPNYERFFPRDVPTGAADRRAYARELLSVFATKAFRRPVDKRTLDRLVTLAEGVSAQPGNPFEAGIAHAMTAVLASPQFLFREEPPAATRGGQGYPLTDEYSLATRLSYFLWSSMPDDELFRLASASELRKQLGTQVKRMMADSRAKALVQNFTGQWLQVRDIASVPIDSRSVLLREQKVDPEMDRRRARLRELRSRGEESLTPAEKEEFAKLRTEFFRRSKAQQPELTGELRQAMRRETELYFSNIISEDRSVVEMIDSDYTFLNERLARHYGLTNLNVTGDQMRRVTLPAGSSRGGVLTMGTVLAVTSNPTRTSPVKRGLFILDNILGTPPPPPPPNIPALEDAAKRLPGLEPSLRELLATHRAQPLCNSCHNRMDPLGLALENFNAMGMWRDVERDQPIEAGGTLLTGETFTNVTELKHILAAGHRREFYRCLTEKLLTYALGRGLDYHDVETVDEIVARLEQYGGRFSALLNGVIESAPFQKTRASAMMSRNEPAKPAQLRTELRINQ